MVGVPGGAREGDKGWSLGRPGSAVYEAFGVIGIYGELFGFGVEEHDLLSFVGQEGAGRGNFRSDCGCEVEMAVVSRFLEWICCCCE